MSISCLEFLDSAKRMMDKGSKEVDYRNAASRAYYAVFHQCVTIAENECKETFGASHIKVITSLQENPKTRALGNRLNKFKKERARADYNLCHNYYERDAKVLISKINKVFAEFDIQSEASSA